MAAAMAVTGWVAAGSGCAAADEPGHPHPLRLPVPSHSFPVSTNSAIFGYFDTSGESALELPVFSYMRRLSGIDSIEPEDISHWLDSSRSGSAVFAVGYSWRALRLEGSAFSRREQERQKRTSNDALFRLDSSSARLSYNPSPDWLFQFSRGSGSLSGLDQMEPGQDVRRTILSVTYNHAVSQGTWRTTLAWGRSARKTSEPTMGYLLESTLHVSSIHAIFGRLEQVGSDELVRENESMQRQISKLKKITVGYFHDVNAYSPLKTDVGIFASKYLVPSSLASYGNDPTSYMLFIRFKLK